MKNILVVFSALILLMGCQTFATVKNIESEKQQLKKSNIETVQKFPDKEDYTIIKTAKPVLCIDQEKALSSLQEVGETPLVTWYNESIEYPVMLFINRKTGTVSLLEYPAMGNIKSETFNNLACLVSHGIGAKVFDGGSKIDASYNIKSNKNP
jgi:hypothetical protein